VRGGVQELRARFSIPDALPVVKRGLRMGQPVRRVLRFSAPSLAILTLHGQFMGKCLQVHHDSSVRDGRRFRVVIGP